MALAVVPLGVVWLPAAVAASVLAAAVTAVAWSRRDRLAVAVFVVVNATAEEVAYRVVAFDAARRSVGPWLAVVVQAATFGTLHVAGFPAGLAGIGLTFLYGLALGAIRLLTGGLRLAIGVHMLADATVAALVLTVLR